MRPGSFVSALLLEMKCLVALYLQHREEGWSRAGSPGVELNPSLRSSSLVPKAQVAWQNGDIKPFFACLVY